MRLFRALPHFRGEAQLTTFLYRIIVNVVNDELRRRQQARRTVSLDDEEAGGRDSLADSGPSPGLALELRRFLLSLGASLKQLSVSERAILTLYCQEQRSYQEICEILNLPMGTMKTHLHRARQKLKAAMKDRITACSTAL